MKWFDGARTRLRLLIARRAAESRMNHEFRFHIEMETDRLMRAKGLAPGEARARRSPRSGASRSTRKRCATGAASRGFAAGRST